MSRPLRIGMLAPISHPVPPPGYGPWERVASDLVEELVALGHEVTLFAAAGSQTSAELVVTAPFPMADPPPPGPAGDLFDPGPDPRVWEGMHIGAVAEAAAAGRFDVVHSHLHVHALPVSRLLPCPMVSTLHGSAWNRAHHPALLAYAEQTFVSLSDAERRFLPELNYVATVHNGIRVADFPVGDGGGGHLLFVGRLAPEKAPDLAIAAARLAGVPLVLAGSVEDRHRDFFEERVRPALEDGSAEYAGPLSRSELALRYGEARGLLMPLRWDEPFGLVVVEALATGTPVVAWRRGAMPELIDEGVTGFVVDDVAGAAAAIPRLDTIDRSACRAAADTRFDARVMAKGDEAVYRTLTET
jgi:glycosyltransferase involved in cell wall biosynthesis